MTRQADPIVVVSDIVPDTGSTNGFAPRLAALLRSLALRCPVELVLPVRDSKVLPPDACTWWEPTTVVDVPHVQRSQLAFKLHHYTVDPLPYMCELRRLDGLAELIAGREPRLVILHLPYLAHVAFHIPEGVPIVFALEEGWERSYATGEAGPLRRWARSTEHRRVQRLYDMVSRRAGAVVVISEEERRYFETRIDPSLLSVVPHGVDTDFFRPSGGSEQDIDVAVFGDLTQARNLSAAKEMYLAAQAHPGDGPPLRWAFVGPADDSLEDMVTHGRDVVTGRVGDLRPWYERARVVVVPATRGTGVKTTLLQAWAMERPVVASEFAALGVGVIDGQNALLASSPEEAVGHCRRLLGDDALRRRLAGEGRATVLRRHRLAEAGEQFADLCWRAAEKPLEAGR